MSIVVVMLRAVIYILPKIPESLLLFVFSHETQPISIGCKIILCLPLSCSTSNECAQNHTTQLDEYLFGGIQQGCS